MLLHMGTISKPFREVVRSADAPAWGTVPDWYFKGRSYAVELSATTIYVDSCSYNDDITFIRIEECDDSPAMRREAEQALGDISWLGPAPIPRLKLENALFLLVGLLTLVW